MPFTVPNKKESYRPLREDEISADLFQKSGFKSVAQINALRYLDFNVDVFLRQCKKKLGIMTILFLYSLVIIIQK